MQEIYLIDKLNSIYNKSNIKNTSIYKIDISKFWVYIK